MNVEEYTERAQGFVQAAQSIGLREGHPQFTPEHVLKALLDDPEGMAAGLIDQAGGDSHQVRQKIEACISRMPKASGGASQRRHDLDPARFEGEVRAATSRSKEAVSNVAIRQGCSGDERRVLDAHAVVG